MNEYRDCRTDILIKVIIFWAYEYYLSYWFEDLRFFSFNE